MYLILTASKDAYITDKIIDNTYRSKDANTGYAATLDVFKLWNESSDIEDGSAVHINGETGPIELSRALIKFDYDTIQGFVDDAKLDIDIVNNPTFECKLRMVDISVGQGSPMNFNLILFPLAQQFDEGFGRDVGSFGDIAVTNWVTASYADGTTYEWSLEGARMMGALGDSNIDIIEYGQLNDGSGPTAATYSTQFFSAGTENLEMDITRIVSASMSGQLDNHGFLLAYSGSEETDGKSRFVKRFASRHVGDPYLRPQIVVSWDDSIIDNHKNFFFDLTGSLFLQNYHYGAPANLVWGPSLAGVTGPSCMELSIVSDQFKKTIDVSQHKVGDNWITGLYTGSFAISSVATDNVNDEDTVADFVLASGSMTFEEHWGTTAGGTFGFHTGSLEIKSISRSVFNATQRRIDLVSTNIKKAYRVVDRPKLRVFAHDLDEERTSVKVPVKLDSKILDSVYYRIRDAITGKIVVPFKTDNNGTRLSADSEGMFFELYMNNLPPGRTYTIDYLVTDLGTEFIVEDNGIQFRVDG